MSTSPQLPIHILSSDAMDHSPFDNRSLWIDPKGSIIWVSTIQNDSIFVVLWKFYVIFWALCVIWRSFQDKMRRMLPKLQNKNFVTQAKDLKCLYNWHNSGCLFSYLSAWFEYYCSLKVFNARYQTGSSLEIWKYGVLLILVFWWQLVLVFDKLWDCLNLNLKEQSCR